MTIYIVFYHHSPLIPKVLDTVWLSRDLAWSHAHNMTMETKVDYFMEEHETENTTPFPILPDDTDLDEKSYRAGFNDGWDCGRTHAPRRIVFSNSKEPQ